MKHFLNIFMSNYYEISILPLMFDMHACNDMGDIRFEITTLCEYMTYLEWRII